MKAPATSSIAAPRGGGVQWVVRAGDSRTKSALIQFPTVCEMSGCRLTNLLARRADAKSRDQVNKLCNSERSGARCRHGQVAPIRHGLWAGPRLRLL